MISGTTAARHGGPDVTADLTAGTTRYAGARIARVEDPRLLTGHGTYVDDVVRPGMLHACFVRSPFARARIVQHRRQSQRSNSPASTPCSPPPISTRASTKRGSRSPARTSPTARGPPLAEDEVRFVGDLVALVVAEDRYIAEDAADLVDVEYDPLTAVVDYATAETNDELVLRRLGRQPRAEGWAGAPPSSSAPVFDEAALVVEETISPAGVRRVADGDARASSSSGRAADQELTVWAASQSPHDLRMFAARLLAVPENRIRVIARDTGGAFGQKINPHREDICMLLAASKVPGRAQVHRGPPREPDGELVAPRAGHGCGWRSTPTART